MAGDEFGHLDGFAKFMLSVIVILAVLAAVIMGAHAWHCYSLDGEDEAVGVATSYPVPVVPTGAVVHLQMFERRLDMIEMRLDEIEGRLGKEAE